MFVPMFIALVEFLLLAPPPLLPLLPLLALPVS